MASQREDISLVVGPKFQHLLEWLKASSKLSNSVQPPFHGDNGCLSLTLYPHNLTIMSTLHNDWPGVQRWETRCDLNVSVVSLCMQQHHELCSIIIISTIHPVMTTIQKMQKEWEIRDDEAVTTLEHNHQSEQEKMINEMMINLNYLGYPLVFPLALTNLFSPSHNFINT